MRFSLAGDSRPVSHESGDTFRVGQPMPLAEDSRGSATLRELDKETKVCLRTGAREMVICGNKDTVSDRHGDGD